VSKILAVATAVPPFVVTKDDAKGFARRFFAPRFGDIERLLELFDHAQIDKRHICNPVEWFASPKSFREKNDEYIRWSLELGSEAVAAALSHAGLLPGDVDYLIFVSTTGLATPSIDARLIGRLGLGAHTRRTPIWGLGCAGGVSGLSHAHHYALAHPHSVTVMVAVELCSLTFHFGDRSKSNLVACALFGDGAAAVVVSGEEASKQGLSIVDTQSTLWPDSVDVMGWDFESEGMQVVFSRDIPAIVLKESKRNVSEFLAKHELALERLSFFVAHPGGAKVIAAYEQALSLGPGVMRGARDVLRDYGNMSSASMLFVLERMLGNGAPESDQWGLATALGPGFSSELVLLRS
jgi:alkylresorcinol/alkylpyrone synthase